MSVMLIGFENSSWGYHSDGGFYHESVKDRNYGPEFTTDDTIGCYLNFKNNMVYYTKNGVHLGNYYLNTNVCLRQANKN